VNRVRYMVVPREALKLDAHPVCPLFATYELAAADARARAEDGDDVAILAMRTIAILYAHPCGPTIH